MNTSVKTLVVPELVRQQIHRCPDATAVSMGEDVISYQLLDQWSDRIAERILSHRVTHPGDPARDTAVAVVTTRTPTYPAAVLGILKAGCAYVPLDLSYPTDRQELILGDSGAIAVLVDESDFPRIAGIPTIAVPHRDERASADLVLPRVAPSDPAYIMFTSGSTGRPKGVVVEHRQVASLMSLDSRVRVAPRQRVTMLAPPAFDASTFELWNTLGNGGELVVFDSGWESVAELGARLCEVKPDWVFLTTGLFHLLAEYDPGAFDTIGTVITGGDVLSPRHVQDIAARRSVRVLAAYGPTEGTTFATLHEVDPDRAMENVPIGTPIRGATLKVVTQSGKAVARGELGELHVGGVGVARGYLDDELTRQKFFTDEGQRWYRTGDLVRQLPSGAYEFHGRIDRQVKIRGFRVEPSEVENALANHPAVSAAAVIAVTDSGSTTRLVAYVVPHDRLEIDELRDWLLGRLPDFMRPAVFLTVPTIPLDRNGKTDHRSLPAPWTRRQDMPALPPYREPETVTQSRIATIWAESLGMDLVGLDDDFRELGGDSLRSVDLVARLERGGITVSALEFFRNPTVRGLATVLAERADGLAASR